MEDLEARQLLSFQAGVNFQPEYHPAPTGYLVDSGKTYGARGNGQTYGWSAAVGTFDRYSTPDYRKDSLAAMQWNVNATWEMAVPNGTYEVTLSAGDGAGWNEPQKINVEGVTVVNGTTTTSNRWITGTATVTVSDGKLTLSSPSTSTHNMPNYIDIKQVDGGTGDTGTGGTGDTGSGGTGGTGDTGTGGTGDTGTGGTGDTGTGGTGGTGDTGTGGTGTTAGTPIKVNFAPANIPLVSGYLADSGKVYGDRGNGYTYGWDKQVTEVTNRYTAADDLYDTLAAMNWQGTYTWEIAVPNGSYSVKIVAGDANGWNNAERITAEGTLVVNGTTTTTNRWLTGTATVNVADGKLTVANGAGAQVNTINFIEITPLSGTGGTGGTGDTGSGGTGGTGDPGTGGTGGTGDTGTGGTGGTTTPPTQPGGVRVGTNLDGMADWATVGAFNDLARMFRPWGNLTKTYEWDPNLPVNADNYPLTDAGTITYAYSYPSGRYKVSYDGTGSLAFSGMNARYTLVSKVGDHYEGYLDLQTQPGAILEMRITGISAANPPRNLHIISPDADLARSDTFRPVFLDKLVPFNGALRFMDWTQTNESPISEWAQRPKPTRFSYTSFNGFGGVPWEHVVKLANTLKKDVWINVPYHATEDYQRNLARFMRDNLDPSLKAQVEYSNEVWNPIFEQMRANQKAAWADPTLTAQDDFGRQGQKFGKLTARMAQIFKEEFGATRFAGQVRVELGGLIAGKYFAEMGLNWIQANVGDPKSLIYGMAIAPYVGVQGDMDYAGVDFAGQTMDGLFTWMNSWVNGQLRTWVRENKALADRFGLKLDSYEGGQHLQYLNNVNADLKTRAQDDPRMADLYRNLLTMWHQESGGGMFGNFALSTNYGPYGFWGLFQSIDQPTSVKYEAVKSMIGKVV